MAPSAPRASAERPLQGAVLCFTSVSPEERTQYAEIALQMGAEHKLDLTSDTTHLIVGSTDTMKYKYVAKEREDIKVLRPEWIEAVRDRWMNDRPMNLQELAGKFRVPTLAGLKICITGFEDLLFRAQLQKNVIENGGEYTGDLTKDVTHLIAASAQGKKYEYGMQWQKKVVSLQWYKDSLERGMQLDETLYHPTTPPNEQGLGAWNRKPRSISFTEKRPRDEPAGPEPSRKLRRTASARLGSQNQSLWTDIVGGSEHDETHSSRPDLKAAVSMPDLSKDGLTRGATRVNKAKGDYSNKSNAGFFYNCTFSIYGFDAKKRVHLQNILVQNSGTIIEDLTQMDPDDLARALILVPHDIGKANKTALRLPQATTPIVSEFWLERCMLEKTFIEPHNYTLGQVLMEPAIPGMTDLSVNATGFDGLETMHISKIVKLVGGKYVEVFTASVSILICKGRDVNNEKLQLARHCGIPVVTAEWLYSTIKSRRKAVIKNYLIQDLGKQGSGSRAVAGKSSKQEAAEKEYVEVSTIPIQRKKGHHELEQARGQQIAGKAKVDTGTRTKADGSWVHVHTDPEHSLTTDSGKTSFPSESSGTGSGNDGQRTATGEVSEHSPLQEISSNSPGKKTVGPGSRMPSSGSQIGSCDEVNSLTEPRQTLDDEPTSKGRNQEVMQGAEVGTGSVQAINGAIRELLEQQAKKSQSNNKESDKAGKKGRLVGRALSNLSNSSITSKRCSRASSVDSMNTDGMGSEIVSLQSIKASREMGSGGEKGGFSFMGRAKSTLSGYKPIKYGTEDPHIGNRPDEMDNVGPPMTQLGYEDPEEAVALREKLAESRRKRSKLGQKDDDPKPRAQSKIQRKIQDDDVLVGGAGWGAGRRTRNKPRGAPDQDMTNF
ncbi:hypothetical protein PV10_04194 [Exophiala mesophila]|uniref:BRCT domain-containing protein n=2 Tax=Exophiala mesophila TaxID=212818 RepID=A0A0D1ZGJ9_EXOME|nr:uncharacterized protein PV10_04194 [Exophiala mesophila]KIV92939.1 hypothetical protein PV10_04194 [Exophiala mesophila]